MFPDDSNDPASTCGDWNFSMRDYVLASRKREISHNWPFPPKYLKMCTEHGINKLLPPFESRDLPGYLVHKGRLRLDPFQEENVCANAIHSNVMATIKVEGTDEHEKGTFMEEAITYVSDQVCLLSLATGRNEHKMEECSVDSATKSKECTVDIKMKGTRESMLDHKLLEFSSSCQGMNYEASDMPKRMVSSLCNLQEQNEVDDFVVHDKSVAGNGDNLGSLVADQSSALDYQAHLKASNSFASTDLPSGKKSGNKRRGKGMPKKQMMADIYARASPFTLEDLDRVNGSNWTTDSSLLPYNSLDYKDNLCSFDERRGSLNIFNESKVLHYSMKKHPRDESSKDNDLLVKKRCIKVKKLKGMPKSRKRNLSSLTSNDCKAGETNIQLSDKEVLAGRVFA